MVTNAERGREVRQRLTAAAVELVAEKGWSAVSTRALADRAGVVPGVVHYHFASVQALLHEAAVAAMRGLVDEFGGLLDQAATPEEVLELMLGGVERYTGLDAASVLFIETYLAATRQEALRADIRDVLLRFRSRLAAQLAEHEVALPEETAAVLVATIDGVILHRALDSGFGVLDIRPVLRRMLTPVAAGSRADGKAGRAG